MKKKEIHHSPDEINVNQKQMHLYFCYSYVENLTGDGYGNTHQGREALVSVAATRWGATAYVFWYRKENVLQKDLAC